MGLVGGSSYYFFTRSTGTSEDPIKAASDIITVQNMSLNNVTYDLDVHRAGL